MSSSTLTPDSNGYSPRAVKMLFDGVDVSPSVDMNFESESGQRMAMANLNNISISEAQE